MYKESFSVRVAMLLLVVVLAPVSAFAAISDADLAITKDDGAVQSTAGTTVTYTIVATNNGPMDATNATVTDMFPASLTCTWTCSASAGSSCTAAGAGDINDTVNLLDGGTATYTAMCSISPDATGSLENTATITAGNEPDPVPENNSATDTNTLGSVTDLAISADFTPAVPEIGEPLTLMVTVDNNGPSTATNVVVESVLPDGTNFQGTSGCVEDPTGVPTCSLGTLQPGNQVMFTITIVPRDDSPQLFTFQVSSDTPDTNVDNDATGIAFSAAFDIPTIGQVGQILMTLMLLGLGIWGVRRLG